MKILVVEDDVRGVARLIAKQLELMRRVFPNAEIIFVSTLEDCMRLVADIPHPDVTLLDLSLPDSTWMNTLSRIPFIEESCPVVVMTGHTEDRVREFLGDSPVEILHKNSSFLGAIFAAIARALQRSKSDNMERVAENIRLMREIFYAPDPQAPVA